MTKTPVAVAGLAPPPSRGRAKVAPGATVLGGQRSRGLDRLAAGIVLTLAVASSPAHAGFLDGKTYDNVSIDGTAYNISFVSGSYENAYGSTPPTFLNNETAAYDAIVVLRALFLLTPHNISGPVNNYDAAWAPYADSGFRRRRRREPSSWWASEHPNATADPRETTN